MILKSISIWLLIIPFAILNGVLRESVLNRLLGQSIALPVSGILLSLFILLISYFLIPKLKATNSRTYCNIGLIWVVLTLIFEFGMGLSMGESFSKMLSAYNPFSGNLWLLVLMVTGVSLWLVMKIRKNA